MVDPVVEQGKNSIGQYRLKMITYQKYIVQGLMLRGFWFQKNVHSEAALQKSMYTHVS